MIPWIFRPSTSALKSIFESMANNMWLYEVIILYDKIRKSSGFRKDIMKIPNTRAIVLILLGCAVCIKTLELTDPVFIGDSHLIHQS